MEKISSIISNSDFLAIKDNKEVETDLDPLTVMVVNRLFNFFEAVCPGYDKQFAGNDNKLKTLKVNFARALMEEGINDIRQLELGVSRCRKVSPINTPTIGQFLGWCKPTVEELGLWNAEQAYKRAIEINRQFADEPLGISPEQLAIIKHAIRETGSWDLRNKSEAQTRPVFQRNYEISVRDFLSGKLKPIAKGIEEKGGQALEIKKQDEIDNGFLNRSCYEIEMAKIKKILGMNNDGV